MFVQAARAEGVEFNIGFRTFHLCRSSRRFRQVGDLAEATRSDANMVVLHHPVLLWDGAAIAQIVQCINIIEQWAEAIKRIFLSHLTS